MFKLDGRNHHNAVAGDEGQQGEGSSTLQEQHSRSVWKTPGKAGLQLVYVAGGLGTNKPASSVTTECCLSHLQADPLQTTKNIYTLTPHHYGFFLLEEDLIHIKEGQITEDASNYALFYVSNFIVRFIQTGQMQKWKLQPREWNSAELGQYLAICLFNSRRQKRK